MITVHPRTRIRKKTRTQKTGIDYVVDLAMLLAPLSLLPQLWEVWLRQNTAGVSLLTWLMTLLITVPLITYDLKHQAKGLAFMHSSIVVICLGIVVRIVI